MKCIALKIDVDSFQGSLLGVPALLALLERHALSASFFFTLGKDRGACEPRATSLKSYYGLRTRLYGRFLPAPNIGKRCVKILQQVQAAGFEVGLHAFNRVAWEKNILRAENAWVEAEMNQGCARFADIFFEPPKAHAAAGWKMNRHALRLTQRLAFDYASDCRGSHPFLPVFDGELIDCPQLPTTLPTLDEVCSLEPSFSTDQAVDRILQLSSAIDGNHVFTLRAELEGMRFLPSFERLIVGWKSRAYPLLSLRDFHRRLDPYALPRHIVHLAESPGRAGLHLTQGARFLQE